MDEINKEKLRESALATIKACENLTPAFGDYEAWKRLFCERESSFRKLASPSAILFLLDENAAQAACLADLDLKRRFFESECETRKKNEEARIFKEEVLQNRIAELEREVAEGDAAIAVWRGRTQRAEKEIEPFRKDAQRYRWIANGSSSAYVLDQMASCEIVGHEIDQAIDAAMQEEAKP